MTQTIKIKVTTRSAKNEILTESDGSLKVKLKAAPVKGKANQELIKVLSRHFDVTLAAIKIQNGLKSKTKLIQINR